jgi:hypothetical protein
MDAEAAPKLCDLNVATQKAEKENALPRHQLDQDNQTSARARAINV